MPWCEPCGRYLTPTTLTEDGDCPSCGDHLADVVERPKAPWHFWLLVIALSIYLGWRLIQGIIWLIPG